LESRRAHAFDESRLRVVETLASQLASSVENVRSTRELLALSEVTRDLTTRHDLPTLLSLIAERAASLLSAVGSGVYLTEEGRPDLRRNAGAGPGESLPERLAAPHSAPQELPSGRTQASPARPPGAAAPMILAVNGGAIVVHVSDCA
jgi:GAF domain-containing protein